MGNQTFASRPSALLESSDLSASNVKRTVQREGDVQNLNEETEAENYPLEDLALIIQSKEDEIKGYARKMEAAQKEVNLLKKLMKLIKWPLEDLKLLSLDEEQRRSDPEPSKVIASLSPSYEDTEPSSLKDSRFHK